MSAHSSAAPTRSLVVRLHPETAERLAIRVAALLVKHLERSQPTTTPAEEPRLLSAAEVSRWWGVHRGWVYEHAQELGAIKIGDGERPRLRFDPERVARRLARPPVRS
jgi:hypothetical protein